MHMPYNMFVMGWGIRKTEIANRRKPNRKNNRRNFNEANSQNLFPISLYTKNHDNRNKNLFGLTKPLGEKLFTREPNKSLSQ